MLPIDFGAIRLEDIQKLIEYRVSEKRTLEYKQALSIGGDENRKEFLGDVCSFANASGGDLIFGISDERDERGQATGLPAALRPLQIDNPSTECARIESLLESGIQPRLPRVQIKSIEVPEGGHLIVVRVAKSWISPHMVTFKNLSRFYSRNSSTGKFQLDVQQIGAAFSLQNDLGERLTNFRNHRVAVAVADEGPVSLSGSRLLFHFVPLVSLTEPVSLMPKIYDPMRLQAVHQLMSLSANVQRHNSDGFLMATAPRAKGDGSYLQIFRNGTLEYADCYVLQCVEPPRIHMPFVEEKIAETFRKAIQLLRIIEAIPPISVSAVLIGARGRTLSLPNSIYWYDHPVVAIDKNVLLCPEIVLENLQNVTSGVLLPIIDSIWQAAGHAGTPNRNDVGDWALARNC